MAIMQVRFLLLGFSILVSQTPKGVRGQCATPPINQAVYEGAPNTIFMCNRNTAVSYAIRPASDPLGTYRITNYDDVVTPAYTSLYGVNQTGLVIKTASGSSSPFSTAGMYLVNLNNATRTGAKLVVVRQPLACSCIAINTTKLNLTCSLVYADAYNQVISAKMNWTSNGMVNRIDIPVRALSNGYYTSTSVITVDDSGSSTYTCNVTFTKASAQLAYVATNAPTFSATCTVAACPLTTTAILPSPTTTTSPLATTTTIPPIVTSTSITTTLETTVTVLQCLSNVKNIAVREGERNAIMNLYVNPQNVSWKVVPTSDELDTLPIIDYGGINNYPALYDVDQIGLIIKDATTNGNPMSTAGLYIGQCANNTNRTGAKLVVVQTGPLCSCIPLDYASNLSCNVTYADSSIQPIYAIVTWKLNGAVLSTATLPRKRNGPYVFYSESTIIGDGGDPSRYTCELSFAAPNNNQFPFVATNAPQFNEACDINACPFTTTIRSTTLTTTAQQPTTFPPTTSSTTTAVSTTTTTPYPSSTDCNCPQTTACPSPEASCTDISECRSDGTNLTDVYDECVVKAELYARCDNCCPESIVCGVVVTLRNDSRWLIHDPLCNKNTCQMVVFDASCMSTDWKLLSERKVAISGVGDYVQAGNGVQIGLNVTDCSESCKIMMNLP